ncbi:malonic semialdehyde reductase [Yunchengibacter salinarum]|uniref:malonic semialdehyde reductase n=1 Tax=Yunchengibacter salinarum TaxID=3133399 RepID=UPI0035B64AF1
MSDLLPHTEPLDQQAFDQLFYDARTANVWSDTPVGEEMVRKLYDALRMGPTSANCCPARFLFVMSREGKEQLAEHVMEGNRPKVTQAPVCVVIGTDMDFPDKMDTLFPHNPDAKHWFDDPDARFENGFRNATLQGAYLIMAARALGLDCGPMSGFDQKGVDKAFFADTNIRSNFLCSIGYATTEKVFPRSPRLPFDEACRIL